MKEIIDVGTTHPDLMAILVTAFMVVLLIAFIVAFRQGRSFSFFNLVEIGAKPADPSKNVPVTNTQPASTTDDVNAGPIKKGGLGSFNEQHRKNQTAVADLRDTVSRIMNGITVQQVTNENGKTFHVGDRFPMPDHRWVTVMNLEPVISGNSTRKFGDIGSVDQEGYVEILGFMETADCWQALVRYNLQETAYGARCPNSTIFFIEL